LPIKPTPVDYNPLRSKKRRLSSSQKKSSLTRKNSQSKYRSYADKSRQNYNPPSVNKYNSRRSSYDSNTSNHRNNSSKQQKSYRSIYESNKRSKSGSKRSIKYISPDKKNKGPIRPPSRRRSYDGNQYGYKISEKLGYQKPTRNSSRREK
jgi:hypothetical protein